MGKKPKNSLYRQPIKGSKYGPVVHRKVQYRDYLRGHPDTVISKQLYREIQKEFFNLLADYLVSSGRDYVLPHKLGIIGIRKVVTNLRKRVDWGATRRNKKALLAKGVKEEELIKSSNPNGKYHYIVLREALPYAMQYWEQRVPGASWRRAYGYVWRKLKFSNTKVIHDYWRDNDNLGIKLVKYLQADPSRLEQYKEM